MSRIVVWGAFDETKPRVRLLLEELRRVGAIKSEISIPVWRNVRDKGVGGAHIFVRALFRLLCGYPRVILKLMREPGDGVILLPYPAIPDIFVAWPIAKLRRHKIIFDAFVSLHDTAVDDRRLIRPNGVAAKIIWHLEKAALSLADVVLTDTKEHAEFFAREFGVASDRLQPIAVGAESIFWNARRRSSGCRPLSTSNLPLVLFYGQLIPLHGIETILEAVRLTKDDAFRWLIIGTGQDEPKVRKFMKQRYGSNVSWVEWVEYAELPEIIASANVGLGIFGGSSKASRVIPNKVFQMLAVGVPVITRESPAVTALAERFSDALKTIPPEDGLALAAAVRAIVQSGSLRATSRLPRQQEFGPSRGVGELLVRL